MMSMSGQHALFRALVLGLLADSVQLNCRQNVDTAVMDASVRHMCGRTGL